MKLNGIILAGALAALVAVATTQAQDLTAIYIEDNPIQALSGTFDGTNYQVLNAGVSRFVGFEAFCVEPHANIPVGPVDYNYFTLAPAPVNDAMAKLVGQYFTTPQTALEAAATQWATWEVLTDGLGGSLSSGNAQVTDVTVSTLGDTYLGNLGSLSVPAVTYLTNASHQDVVGLTGSIIVPEPSVLGLLTASVLLILRRRRS